MQSNAGAATVGSRLADTAARFAQRAAIVEDHHEITYAMLDASATRIACRLADIVREDALARDATKAGAKRASGDAPAVPGRERGAVCLLFERKLPALEALFGAARAGVPYVLLDAGDPEARLRFIANDSEPVALLTERSLVERARGIAPATCPVVDVADIADTRARCRLPDVDADAPLYYCYTSGSTGQPKGVGQTHRNLLFFADAYAGGLRIGERDRLSLVYTLSFNAANMDIFGALLRGATLCAYDARRGGARELADWLDASRVSVLHTVPTLFRELAKHLPAARVLPHLRIVDLGGEAVFRSDVELFRAHTRDDCRFVNQLASTEVGLIAQHVIDHARPLPNAPIVPVGRCPEGVVVTVERDDGTRADVDEPGEIVVASRHMSPGYRRRPDLDRAVFREDATRPGWRAYRSGDVGRIDASGDLHFLGRKGGRVKVRGHTVDVAEIEATLATCPGVARAAVVADPATGDATGERLVAHVAIDEGHAADAVRVRRHLAANLPAYMLPHTIAFVDAIPLTSSGKVDRAALANIVSTRRATERRVEPAHDDVERAIIAIAEALLGVAPIGRDDDFFLLGGDSLMAVELQARLFETFGVHVGGFHEDATLARIARDIRAAQSLPARAQKALPVLIPLWRDGSAPPLFLVHGRHGQAFVSPHFMRLLGNDQPVWAFQARGLDGVQPPYASVDEMAADYVAQMRARKPRGPYFIGALCAGAFVAAAMARALRNAGEVVLPLLLLDPPDLLERGYSQMSEARFIDKMKTRRRMGGTIGPIDDAYMQSVLRVARGFEDALARHRPEPYDGAVYMLSSRQRMQTARALAQVFKGPTERFEIGASHADALDPRNPHFAACLLRCLARIRETANDGSAGEWVATTAAATEALGRP